jgi:hypothetical protein
MRNYLAILIIVLVLACSKNSVPRGILSEKQITPVLVELHLAEAINAQQFTMEVNRNNFKEDLYLSILKKFKLDRTVFEASVLYYGKHPDLYKPVYDEVLNRLNEMEVKNKAKDSIDSRKPRVKPISKDTIQAKTTGVKVLTKDSVPTHK